MTSNTETVFKISHHGRETPPLIPIIITPEKSVKTQPLRAHLTIL